MTAYRRLVFIILALAAFQGCGGVNSNAVRKDAIENNTEEASLENRWGVEVQGVRLSAEGNVLDFRFRVLDPDKALPIVERKNRAYVVDLDTGAELEVPSMQNVGALRQTVRNNGKPRPGSTFFILFGNSNRLVKKGGKVTVVVGDFRAENIMVE